MEGTPYQQVRIKVAFLIAGIIQNDQFTGHRISITHKRKGKCQVTVYDADGSVNKAVSYRRMERAIISRAERKGPVMTER